MVPKFGSLRKVENYDVVIHRDGQIKVDQLYEKCRSFTNTPRQEEKTTYNEPKEG
jgi:hypothetical protein